jgi:ribosomal-protein-alanine N-acetyltransferase
MYFLSKLNFFDFENYFSLVKDERVMAMITESGLSRNEAKLKFDQIVNDNEFHPDYGYYKITDLKDTFIGVIKLEINGPHSTEAELGYILKPEYWNQGIGSETANFLITKAKKLGYLNRISAIIDPDNIASRKILVKNNFISKEYKDMDELPGEIFELLLPS